MANYIDPNSSSLNVDARPGSVSRASWILLVSAIASVAFVGVLWYQTTTITQDTATLQRKVADDKGTLTNLQTGQSAKDIPRLIAETNGLQSMFSSQKKWEVVLDNIQKRMYKKTVITAFSLSQTGLVTISGLTGTHTDYKALYVSLTNTAAQSYFTGVKPLSVAVASSGADAAASKITYPGLPENPISFSFSFNLTPAMYSPIPSS